MLKIFLLIFLENIISLPLIQYISSDNEKINLLNVT